MLSGITTSFPLLAVLLLMQTRTQFPFVAAGVHPWPSPFPAPPPPPQTLPLSVRAYSQYTTARQTSLCAVAWDRWVSGAGPRAYLHCSSCYSCQPRLLRSLFTVPLISSTSTSLCLLGVICETHPPMSDGTGLIFLLAVGTGLWFGFKMSRILVTH